MKLSIHKTPSAHLLKKRRFNPHRVWTRLLIVFILALIGILVYFSWYFVDTTRTLDAPPTANLETNASKIISMQQTLGDVERVVEKRVGTSSQ